MPEPARPSYAVEASASKESKRPLANVSPAIIAAENTRWFAERRIASVGTSSSIGEIVRGGFAASSAWVAVRSSSLMIPCAMDTVIGTPATSVVSSRGRASRLSRSTETTGCTSYSPTGADWPTKKARPCPASACSIAASTALARALSRNSSCRASCISSDGNSRSCTKLSS